MWGWVSMGEGACVCVCVCESVYVCVCVVTVQRCLFPVAISTPILLFSPPGPCLWCTQAP